MVSAVLARGTVLVWNYRKLLEMVNITGVSQSLDIMDVSNHDSSSQFREFLPGLLNGGEVSIDGNFIPGDDAGQIALHADMQSKTIRIAFIVMPMAVGDALSFTALASGFGTSFPHDGKAGVSGTLRINGKPVFLTAQSTGISDITGIEETGGAALSIEPSVSAGTYEYACTVDAVSTWVKLTVTAAGHTIYIQGTSVASGIQSGEIALGAAGTTTDIFIMVYEVAKAPRLYTLAVIRPSG